MPLMEMAAISVVPPPMSTTMLPEGSSMGSPAPIAAAMACSTRKTSLARARYAESCTARFSTGVISLGTPMTMRGCRSEEHTSELQSQSNLVCRLLLEKKNSSPPHVNLALGDGWLISGPVHTDVQQ